MQEALLSSYNLDGRQSFRRQRAFAMSPNEANQSDVLLIDSQQFQF